METGPMGRPSQLAKLDPRRHRHGTISTVNAISASICGRLAQTTTEVVELIEAAKSNTNVSALAAVSDGNFCPECQSKPVLQGERVGISFGSFSLKARGLSRVLSQALDISNSEAFSNYAVSNDVWIRDREQGARVAR
jgi:hypothetical protein